MGHFVVVVVALFVSGGGRGKRKAGQFGRSAVMLNSPAFKCLHTRVSIALGVVRRVEYLHSLAQRKCDLFVKKDAAIRRFFSGVVILHVVNGGPRYMYKHYQDALAICRVHGNPQFFATFTYNVKWPEIKGCADEFPGLKAREGLMLLLESLR
nr:hypothetical protein [Tanacetum cinerariifolium]